MLTGPATAALDEAKAAEDGPKVLSGQVKITLKVNGDEKACTVEPRSTLLDTLRNRLDVTGPKRVCDRASCGACTTIVDGDAVYSCTTLAVSCQGKTIETLESFDTGHGGRPARLPPARRPDVRLLHARASSPPARRCLDKNPNPTLEEVTRRGSTATSAGAARTSACLEAALAAAKAMKGA